MNDPRQPLHEVERAGALRVQVVFELAQKEDGWPPVTSERLWANIVGVNVVEVVNIPMFACGLSLGDRVSVTRTPGEWRVVQLEKASAHSTFRIFLTDPAGREALLEAMAELGVEVEWAAPAYPQLYALNIAGQVPIQPVQAYLERSAQSGELDYEEATIRHVMT